MLSQRIKAVTSEIREGFSGIQRGEQVTLKTIYLERHSKAIKSDVSSIMAQ
jgi:hypothetical protein